MDVRWSWWLDLNETLIRTGRVDLEDRLREQRSLERFRALCAHAGSNGGLDLIWVTGNTFEYARRVEEPLGLRLLPGVRWWVASENGLIGRTGGGRTLWRAIPLDGWQARIEAWLRRWGRGRWAMQANEVRVTVKPEANRFTPDELEGWRRGFSELSGWTAPWLHPFYLDLDPIEVMLDGVRAPAPDKAWAARRISSPGARVCAVGDSASDASMLQASLALGGAAWWVANAAVDGSPGRRTVGAFTDGVLEALEQELERG